MAETIMDEMASDKKYNALPRTVVKGHFQDTEASKKGKVVADDSGIEQTNAVRNMPWPSWVKRLVVKNWIKKDKRRCNQTITLEVLACNLAKAMGMETQDQSLVFSEYTKVSTRTERKWKLWKKFMPIRVSTTIKFGKMKLLAEGKWDFGMQEMGKDVNGDARAHAGGNSNGGRYLVKLADADKNHYLSDNQTITNLGEQIVGIGLGDDYDTPGSRLQNKGWKPESNTFFGFDFGHALQRFGFVNHLDDAFSFDRGGEQYKNFSAFYDNPLSDKMKGVHYLRKMITGESPSEKIMAGYWSRI